MREDSPNHGGEIGLGEVFRRPLPLVLVLLVVLGASLFNLARLETTPLSSDQVNIATLLLKYREPSLFPGDPALRLLDFYPKTYVGVLDLVVSATGGVKRALLCLGAVLALVFAAGMYLLLYDATGDRWIAAVLAVAALWFRAAFGGSEWQVLDFGAFLPRTITLAMAPWLLLACGRAVGRWSLVGLFAALGIAANFHPLSAMFLAMAFGVALLLIGGRRARHVAILAVSVVVFWAAAAPYFLEIRRAVRAAGEAAATSVAAPSPELIEEVMKARTPALFFPHWRTIRWVAFYLVVPAAVGAWGFWTRRRRFADRDRAAVAFFAGVLVVAIGGTAFLAFLRASFGFGKAVIFMRAFKLVYLPLWVFCAWAVEELWKRRGGRAARLGAVAVCAVLLFPPSGLEYAVRWVKYGGKIPTRPSLELDRDFRAVCDWARENTDRSDKFLVPAQWHIFRLLARRSAVATSKEVSLVMYDPPAGVAAYERWRAVLDAYASRSPDRLIEVAKRYGARYILVSGRELAAKEVFRSGPYRLYRVEAGGIPSARAARGGATERPRPDETKRARTDGR